MNRAIAALMFAYDGRAAHSAFFSVGNSRAVAQAAQHKFFRVGIHTITYSDGQMQVMSATSIVVTVSESPLASAGHVELSSDHPEGF